MCSRFTEYVFVQYFILQYLPKGTRPQLVTDWIQSARPVNENVLKKKILDIRAFEDQFRAWWWKIQPAGRSRSDDGWPIQDDKAEVDWNKIRYSGLNGMWSIMIALCWWGAAFGSESERDSSAWMVAVYDVRYVLWRLVETAPAALADDSLGANSSKSREPVGTSRKQAKVAQPDEPRSSRRKAKQTAVAETSSKRKSKRSGEADEEGGPRLRKR